MKPLLNITAAIAIIAVAVPLFGPAMLVVCAFVIRDVFKLIDLTDFIDTLLFVLFVIIFVVMGISINAVYWHLVLGRLG